jgi:hypothetical protein
MCILSFEKYVDLLYMHQICYDHLCKITCSDVINIVDEYCKPYVDSTWLTMFYIERLMSEFDNTFDFLRTDEYDFYGEHYENLTDFLVLQFGPKDPTSLIVKQLFLQAIK